MAKSIKFNLIVDGKPIRTIEELRENFCINDIDELYREGRLQKWLEVRGFDDYLAKVQEIKHDAPIYQLIDIFDMKGKISKEKINEIVSNIYYKNERKRQLEAWEKKNNDVNSIIQGYHKKYNELKEVMIKNPSNFPLIKSTINEICENYFHLFELNYADFYHQIYKNVPLIVYACLMNIKSRELFLGCKITDKKSPIAEHVLRSFSGTFEIVNNCDNKEDITKYIHRIEGSTGGYWDEKEPSKQKVMILNMSSGAEINSAGKKDGKLTWSDAKEFVMLNGLQYRSQSSSGYVSYMLVN